MQCAKSCNGIVHIVVMRQVRGVNKIAYSSVQWGGRSNFAHSLQQIDKFLN